MISTGLIFDTKILIWQSKAHLFVNILFVKITDHFEPEIGKMLTRDWYGNESSKFDFGP